MWVVLVGTGKVHGGDGPLEQAALAWTATALTLSFCLRSRFAAGLCTGGALCLPGTAPGALGRYLWWAHHEAYDASVMHVLGYMPPDLGIPDFCWSDPAWLADCAPVVQRVLAEWGPVGVPLGAVLATVLHPWARGGQKTHVATVPEPTPPPAPAGSRDE